MPMYCLPEMADANAAFWMELQQRLCARGVDTAGIKLESDESSVPEGIGRGTFFTQICGYPLFKHYRDQGIILATPHYAAPGCVGSTHRAFFMVRVDDPAERLEDLRGRIFGCNSLLSNSGMNLPRLSLARIAHSKPFFSSVIMTGGHVASLQRLGDRSIDVCSIDSVTWGFFGKFRPIAAQRYRILDETVAARRCLSLLQCTQPNRMQRLLPRPCKRSWRILKLPTCVESWDSSAFQLRTLLPMNISRNTSTKPLYSAFPR